VISVSKYRHIFGLAVVMRGKNIRFIHKVKKHFGEFNASVKLHLNNLRYFKQLRAVPEAALLREIQLGNWGGRLFVEDINNDGLKEFLWLQTAGMFKSKIYDQSQGVKNYFDIVGRDIFCLTATDQHGDILWQTGAPYSGEYAYLSHAAEHMLAFGDINNDGYKEILVFDESSHLLVLSPLDGAIIKKIQLPADNFSIVHYIQEAEDASSFKILLGVTDRGYPPHPYGNPRLIMNNQFEVISSKDYRGAGHYISVDDVNRDERPEVLMGYQLVDLEGETIWIVDYWKGRDIDPRKQHVDHVATLWLDGQWFAAIAGSDRLYFVNSQGKTLWSKYLPHPQFCLIGSYQGEKRIFVLNQREIMNSIRLDGTEVWRGILPENWPMGKPKCSNPARPIHMDDPAALIPGKAGEDDYILYKEGGWPYLIDFNGQITKKFPHTSNIPAKNPALPFHRINDIGLSYEAESADINNDGKPEVLIYNREYLWIYTL